MREIKFRAWDKKGKLMIPFDTPRLIEEYSCISWDSSEYSGIGELPGSYDYLNNNIKNYVLMQHTGLKDKNGKEIYEGDIVSVEDDFEQMYDTYEGVVSNKPVCTTHEVIYNAYGYFAGDYGLGEFPCEVIGNIYENPDVMKKRLDI